MNPGESFDRLLASVPSQFLIAPDLRGHGHADKPEMGYSLVEVVADVVALLGGLEITRVQVLGSSSGGYLRSSWSFRIGACGITDPGGSTTEHARETALCGRSGIVDRSDFRELGCESLCPGTACCTQCPFPTSKTVCSSAAACRRLLGKRSFEDSTRPFRPLNRAPFQFLRLSYGAPMITWFRDTIKRPSPRASPVHS
ncbi:alpha/beta hydrolase [Arthrobacter sp. Rue61a]|uniref:alpha/beta fold hydrolase n=1 Tax=Arthrobacter sp. Rue61a TaxID=1118963 RepID=UPI00336A03FF